MKQVLYTNSQCPAAGDPPKPEELQQQQVPVLTNTQALMIHNTYILSITYHTYLTGLSEFLRSMTFQMFSNMQRDSPNILK